MNEIINSSVSRVMSGEFSAAVRGTGKDAGPFTPARRFLPCARPAGTLK